MKNNKKNSIEEFTIEFFRKYGCKINHENGMLTVSNVPKNFEEIVGKKSPYKIAFDAENNNSKDAELITKGSQFIRAYKDFLQNTGDTTLFKIINYKGNIFFRFIFFTEIQYLNEKKQYIKHIFIENHSSIKKDLSKIKIKPGNKEDIEEQDLKEDYEIARDELGSNLSKNLSKAKELLKEKLRKNIYRIKKHYKKQLKEKDYEIEQCKKKILLCENQLKHAYYDDDIKNIKTRISKYNALLSKLEKEGFRQRLLNEEKFHINDEIKKHSLLIKNRLINISVFY